jgi:hypothetical protein
LPLQFSRLSRLIALRGLGFRRSTVVAAVRHLKISGELVEIIGLYHEVPLQLQRVLFGGRDGGND